jgi:3-isopropylmalate/(R)-2-methylmalate dehydratase small subunit
MSGSITGIARLFGDNVNTDYIISSRRKRESLDPAVLKNYLFETIEPEFAGSVRAGDILVAGKNFGCGSAMEVAVTAVIGAGIRIVLAQSFARTYFRNAVNNGLYPIECDTSRIANGSSLRIDMGPRIVIHCAPDSAPINQEIEAASIPNDILKILDAGGLVPYLREHSTL